MQPEYLPTEIELSGNHNLRQAGTVGDFADEYTQTFRELAEKDLYTFSVSVVGRHYLTESLHAPVCEFLQDIPGYRKMLLLPRRHAKTSLVSHCLPPHILIQPLGGVYTPWKEGRDVRILLAQEMVDRATGNLRTIKSILTSNETFRRLWPTHIWGNPNREADKWNEQQILIPRNETYPDPSIMTVGVTGAICGGRFDVIIKDDLVADAASNSEKIMQQAIDWHIFSRALFDDYDRSLEYIIGTRWAVQDLYGYIQEKDPTVDILVRSIVEDGQIIYPEAITWEAIERLKREYGPMYYLLFMNNAVDAALVEFSSADIRKYIYQGGDLIADDDPRDQFLEEWYDQPAVELAQREPKPNATTWERLRERPKDMFWRFRA